MPIDLVGAFAAIFTTVSFVPQAVRVIKTQDTAAISLSMYLMFSIGVAFWLAYGVLLDSVPIILANIVTLALALVILTVKIRAVLAQR